MEAVIFALIAFVGWGVGDILVAITARKIDPYSAVFWSMFLTVILFSPYALYTIDDLVKLTPQLLLLTIFLAILLMGGILSYREALRIGNPALVGTIGAGFTAVTTILAIIFFSEHLTTLQYSMVVLIFLGVFLSIFDIKEIIKRKVRFDRGVVLALISMLTWGIYFAFVKIPVREVGWFWPFYISFLLFPILYIFMRIRSVTLSKPTVNNALVPLVVSTFMVRVAEFSFSLGISRGFTSFIAPIAGASPVLFVVLAFLVFKNPITRQQILGIIITLIGIVLLSVFSV